MRCSQEFQEAVFSMVQEIPFGFVLSYKDVACAIGYPNRARHVGSALSMLSSERTQRESIDCVPWWRVIRSDGSIAMQGSDARGMIQVQHLKEENILFRGCKICINDFRWIYT